MNLLRMNFRAARWIIFLSLVSAGHLSEWASADGPYVVISSRRPDSDSSVIPTYGVTRNDLQYMRQLKTVRFAAPIRAMRTHVSRLERQTDAVVLGTTETLLKVISDRHGVRVQSGRYLSAEDVAARNNVAVLSDRVARMLFGESDPIGENIKAYGDVFLVVGTFQAKISPESRKALPGGVHIPLTTMRARFGDTFFSVNDGRQEGARFELSQIWLLPTTPSALAPTSRLVESLLEQTHEKMDYSIDMVR